jgi:capsular exopolysaccharide synthesis family protein
VALEQLGVDAGTGEEARAKGQSARDRHGERVSVDLQTYLRILRKHWRVIPIVSLAVLAATAGITYLIPKTYESQLQFFVSTVDTSNNSQLAQGSDFLQQRVKSYSQLLKAPVVLQPVVDKVGLETSPSRLAEQVTTTIPTDTVLIDVTVTERSPQTAQRIAIAIGEQFPKTITELERVSSDGHSPVKVTVTQDPTLELVPVSPKPIRNFALGLVLGVIIAIATVVLRHLLDTRVRTKEDVERLTDDIALIGTIPFDAEATAAPLLVETGPLSTRSESFRTLRTNLAFVGTAERARTIVMTSSLPGEGKTTTSANLGVVLAESGASVCLVEADLRRPRLLDYFGMEGAVGLTDLLIGRADLADILQPYGRHQLALLGAGQIPPNPSELLGSPAMREALQELSEKFDYVLLDAPPMLPVTDAAVLATISDGAVLVVGSGLVTRDQLATAIEGLDKVNARILGTVLNRMPRPIRGRYYDYKYEYHPRREKATFPDGPIDWGNDTIDDRVNHRAGSVVAESDTAAQAARALEAADPA